MRKPLSSRKVKEVDNSWVINPSGFPGVLHTYFTGDESKIKRFRVAFDRALYNVNRKRMADDVADIKAKALEVEQEMAKYITTM